MRKPRLLWAVFVVWALVCVALPVAAQTETTKGFLPTWKVGDKWVVEATYRDMKTVGEPWLPPIEWVFHVRSLKNIHRQSCYVIHVFPKKKDIKVQAVLYLSSIDLRVMRVIDIFPTAYGVKSRMRPVDPFKPEPLLSEDSLIPYDLPVFPLVRRSSTQLADGLNAYKAPEPKDFASVKTLGSFRFKNTVSQTEKTPDRQLADSFAGYRTGGDMFQIELYDNRSRGMITQMWQDGSPWALSTEAPHRKARLVPPAAPDAAPIQPTGGR